MAMPDDFSVLRQKPFAEAIAKFEELLNQSGRAFLIGAGCSKCAGLPLTSELTGKIIDNKNLDVISKEILTAIQHLFGSAGNAHIEDYLSELIDLLAVAERRVERSARHLTITLGGTEYSAEQLRCAADKIKRTICEAVQLDISIDVHRSFATAVHRPLRAGRAMPEQVVDYLVLNYDTVIEDALALEQVPFSDGIDGGATGWWRPETFERDGLAARVLKLHGSINWRELPGDPLPRRIALNLQARDATDWPTLIWPASTKYRETQLDPFAQLADLARHAMRPRSGSQRVLVICGYGFADRHINIEVDRALRESEGDLTVVAFTSDNEPRGQLKKWTDDNKVRTQVLIFAKRGFFHGELSETSKEDLPWWKFENITRLLGGER